MSLSREATWLGFTAGQTAPANCKHSILTKPLAGARLCLLLGLALGLHSAAQAQTNPNPVLGAWSGALRYGNASMQVGVRFQPGEKNSVVMYFDLPEMKAYSVGPLAVEQKDDEYKVYFFSFRLAPDKKSLKGRWSFDGHDLTFDLQPGGLPAVAAPQPAPGRIAQPVWTFKTGDAIWSSPAVAENTVYFGSNDGNIYALKADSGKPAWQFKTGGRVMGSPALDGGYLYELSDDGYLYKLDRRSGKAVWQFDTHGGGIARSMEGEYDYMSSTPAVAGGTVYIGSADKKLYAVDAERGQEKWHFDTQGIIRAKPAVADGRVFFASWDHNVYAVDAATGALQWKYDTLREVTSSPLVANGTVYIGSRSSDLFAFDAASGKIKWKFFYWSSWVESTARLRDGILYVGSSDYQQLFAIDAATGKSVWNFDTDGSAWSTPAVTDKLVYVGTAGVLHYYLIEHHGGFYAVDRATGKVAWRYPLGPIPGSITYGVASSPAVDHGLVFFGALDRTFYAFRTEG